MKKILVAILAFVVVSVVSCKKDMAPEPTCTEVISFTNQLSEYFEMNCSTSGCHDASTSTGYNLTSYVGIHDHADKILSAIRHEGPNPMPLGGSKAPDSLIQQFACWIEQGKLNN